MRAKNNFQRIVAGAFRLLVGCVLALSFNTVSPVHAVGAYDLTLVLDHSALTDGDQGKTLTVTVQNNAGGADKTDGSVVTVVDTLPSKLTATAISGTGWSCTLATLTCTRSDNLLQGNSYPVITITVNVALDAPDLITNSATVSVPGGDSDSLNDTIIDDIPVTTKPDLVITDYQLRDDTNTSVITASSLQPDQGFWIRLTVKNQGGANSGVFYPGVFLDGKPNYGIDHDPLGEVTHFSPNVNDPSDFYNYNISPAGTYDPPQQGCVYYDPNDTINPLTQSISDKLERGNYTRLDYLNDDLASGASTTLDVYIGYPNADYPQSIYDTDNVRTGLHAGSYNLYLYVDPNCASSPEINEYNNYYGPINLSIDATPLPTSWAGSVTIESNRNIVAVGRPQIGTTDTQIMSYNGFASGNTTMYVPMLFKHMWGSYDAALYIQNIDPANTANITIKFYDTSGALSCTKTDTISPLSSKGYWLPSEMCLPASWVGGVVITSDRNIVAVGRPHIGNEIMTYDGFNGGNLLSYVPMLFKNMWDSYNSAFYVQNLDTSNTASVTLKFYDTSGNLTCTRQDAIPALSSLGYWVPTLVCLP